MKIVLFEGVESGSPDSVAWHAWRAQGLGGSDAAVIAAQAGIMTGERPSWQKSAEQLFGLKTGRAEDGFKGNWATERGRQGEPIVRAAYEKATGILVSPMFGEMDGAPFIRSSFDGLTLDFGVITEIKCMGAKNHKATKEGKIVPYYKPQLAHQALTAWGQPEGWEVDREVHFVSGVPELLTGESPDPEAGLAIARVRAKSVREYAARLFDAETAFWAKVQAGLKAGDLAPLAGGAWLDLARVWKDAVAAAKAAAKDKADIEAVMQSYLASNNLTVGEGGGVRFAQVTRQGAVDYDRLLADKLPGITSEELAAYRKPESSGWQARAVKE